MNSSLPLSSCHHDSPSIATSSFSLPFFLPLSRLTLSLHRAEPSPLPPAGPVLRGAAAATAELAAATACEPAAIRSPGHYWGFHRRRARLPPQLPTSSKTLMLLCCSRRRSLPPRDRGCCLSSVRGCCLLTRQLASLYLVYRFKSLVGRVSQADGAPVNDGLNWGQVVIVSSSVMCHAVFFCVFTCAHTLVIAVPRARAAYIGRSWVGLSVTE